MINLVAVLRLLHTPFWKASTVFYTKAALIFVSCWWICVNHSTLSSSKVPVRHEWQVFLLGEFLRNGACSSMSVELQKYSFASTHDNTHQTIRQHQAQHKEKTALWLSFYIQDDLLNTTYNLTPHLQTESLPLSTQ